MCIGCGILTSLIETLTTHCLQIYVKVIMILRSMAPRMWLFFLILCSVVFITYFEMRVMKLEDSKRKLVMLQNVLFLVPVVCIDQEDFTVCSNSSSYVSLHREPLVYICIQSSDGTWNLLFLGTVVAFLLGELAIARMQLREVDHRRGHLPSVSMQDVVIIYNRVPKTGSTSFVGVAYDLCKQNGFHVLHINITGNMHALSLSNQLRFVQNVSHWDAMKPALYHGHLAFVDFARFGVNQRPLYINLIRKPLDRLVSYYYFLRHGDNFRPHLIRRKHGDKMTFDECVKQQQSDCDPENMWLQIPFFCGHAAECWLPGNEWALSEAKKNLLEHYFLVGVTEELGDFIKLLEVSLPSFFRGASAHYETSNKSHLRRTTQKVDPLPETVAQIQKSKIWKMENELYEYALEQFHYAKKRTLTSKDGGMADKNQHFMYEKIRPK